MRIQKKPSLPKDKRKRRNSAGLVRLDGYSPAAKPGPQAMVRLGAPSPAGFFVGRAHGGSPEHLFEDGTVVPEE